MQPLKMIIPGAYYDSQIYSGRLFLWCEDSSIRIFNWDQLLDSVSVNENLRLALTCGFQRSDYLYGSRWDLIFKDLDIRNAITDKFLKLGEHPIVISESLLSSSEVKHQKNPIPFPHSDLLIYSKKLFVGGKDGIFSTVYNKRNANPISLRSIRLWDAPVLSLAASYGALSLSCGDEGLFEMDLYNGTGMWMDLSATEMRPIRAHNLSILHSTSSRWAYYSIFSSSHHNSGYLADFEKQGQRDTSSVEAGRRIFQGIVRAEIIFNEAAYSWGSRDKFCQVKDNKISVVQFNPWDEQNKFRTLGQLTLRDFKGDIVSGDSGLFGYVIECDNGIVVLDSNLENIWIAGEPVNWRVFPRSTFYENQLHVIYDDRLDIYSFNDDYFVKQDQKKAGLRYYDREQTPSRRAGDKPSKII